MNPWSALVHLVERGIAGTAGLLGGSMGAGVFVLVLVVRLGLIPILLPLARRTRSWRAVHRRIKPEIAALNQAHRDDPSKLQQELKALHRSHGIGVVDGAGLWVALIQVPLLIAFFQAVLHLSSGTPLASGGLVWGVLAGAVSWAGTVLGDPTTPKPLVWISAVLPVLITLWLGSGVGLYLIAFYAGTLVQSLLVRRVGSAAASPA